MAPGETVLVTLANAGGADTAIDYDLRLVDARGYAMVSAAASARPIQAGESFAVGLALPDQVASGHYTLRGTAIDRTTGEQATVYAMIEVSGLEASLVVFTDRPAYLSSDVMTMTAEISATQPLGGPSTPLGTGGTLTLRVTQPAGAYRAVEPEITPYTMASSGIGSDWVHDFAFDGQGNVYFATTPIYDYDLGQYVGGGVSVLQITGEWDTYTTDNTGGGLVSDWVYHVAVDQEGNVWAATNWYGLSMRTPEGNWQTFASPPLPDNTINDMVLDAEGNVWVGTSAGLGVRWAADGSWATYTTADGLLSNQVRVVAVDALGNVWCGHGWSGSGASVRLADGTWTVYTTADGLGESDVQSIAVAANGDVFIGHEEGQNVISIRRADGSWETIASADVDFYSATCLFVDDDLNIWVGHWDGAYVLSAADGVWRRYTHAHGLGGDNVISIAAAPDGARWVATSPDSDLGYPGGATAVRGPLVVFSPWQSYAGFFEDADEITAVAIDPAGNRWFAGGRMGEGYTAFLYRLSADGSTWDGFDAGWQEVRDLAVDGAGTAWLVAGGVRARDIDGIWTDYTVESTGGGLLSNDVESIAVDAHDRVWFAALPGQEWDPDTYQYVNVGGGVSVLSGTTWITYTAGNSGLPSNWVHDVTPGGDGNVWVAVRSCEGSYCDFWSTAGNGVAMLSGSNWITYTTANSGLYADEVTAIAVDGQGNAWFGHENALSLRRADGSWDTFTAADGLPECSVTAIAVGRDGTVWLGCEGQGIVAFSPTTGEPALSGAEAFTVHTVASTCGGLVSNNVVDLAVDGMGDVWVAGGDYYDEDLGDWVDAVGVSRYTGLTRVLWQSTAPVDLAGGSTLVETASIPVSDLGATGRLYLEGDLLIASGQQLAFDRQPFTVHQASGPALSLGVTPFVAAPGETVALEGSLRNGDALPLSGQVITVTLGGQLVDVLTAPDIPAGETWTFSVTATAPAAGPALSGVEGGIVWAEATDGTRTARDQLTVSAPTLDVTLEAPDVVGRAPFDLVVVLENPSLHAIDGEVTIGASDPDISDVQLPISVPSGETRVLVESTAISDDTTFTVVVSGDPSTGSGQAFERTLVRAVAFGEAATVSFSPQPVYPEGPVAIPYTATNTGVLPVQFTIAITVQSPISNLQSQISVYLPVGASTSGSLLLDLEEGDPSIGSGQAYTLSYATPFGSGVETFRVAPAQAAELSATAGPSVGSTAVVTVHLTNTGALPIVGSLRVEAPFYTAEQSISLTPTLSHSHTLNIDLTTAEPGTHPVTLTLLAGSGVPLASTAVSVTAPGPDFVVTDAPEGVDVRAGEWVTLTFGVKNEGSAPGMAVITATVGDLLDEEQSVWLAGGESGTVTFVFRAPDLFPPPTTSVATAPKPGVWLTDQCLQRRSSNRQCLYTLTARLVFYPAPPRPLIEAGEGGPGAIRFLGAWCGWMDQPIRKRSTNEVAPHLGGYCGKSLR